jgi:opacity protein-like surface antigen
MKMLKLFVLSAILISGMISKSFAGASDFSGFYVGLEGQAAGAEVDGKFTDGNGEVSKGTAGAVSPMAGIAVGYSYAVDDSFFVGVEVSMNPLDADFKADEASNNNDVTVNMENIITVAVEPSFSTGDNSAVYLKLGYSEFELDASGAGLDAAQSFTLEGMTVGIGTKTIHDSGMFIKTEAGITEYDSFKLINVGDDDGTVQADPTIAYGKVTVGFKF